MKKSILLCLLAFSFSVSAQTIWRCNNDPSVTLSPNMFRTLQAAHDAATAGDIIYVEPSYNSTTYGGLVCTKTLRIIGNGYEQTNNTSISQPWIKTSSNVAGITIQKTAPNTVIEGLFIVSLSGVGVIVEALNCRISRSYVSSSGNTSIYIVRDNTGKDGSGAIITKNKLANINLMYSGYTAYNNTTCSYTPYQVENIQINNNFFDGYEIKSAGGELQSGGGPCSGGGVTVSVPNAKNLTFKNNICKDYYPINIASCENCTAQNNILRNITIPISTLGFTASNNVCNLLCGYGSNNVQNVTASNIFIVTSPSKDEDFRLSPTSLATGAGVGGIDAGAFGGSDPYRISGLAPIPQITSYSKNASSGVYTTSTPMTVTISVRGNN